MSQNKTKANKLIKKTCNIITHWENENRKQNEIKLYTCQVGFLKNKMENNKC